MDISVLTATIILCIVIILSLIGNTLVVVISVFYMKLRSLTSIFILNLALSDLLFTVGLLFLVYALTWGWTFGDATCTVVYCIFLVGFYSNMLLLVLMTVQQYTTMVHPHSGWKKRSCVRCVLICAWVMGTLAALNSIYSLVTIFRYSRGCIFGSKTPFHVITFKESIVFLCAFLFMVICYIRILQTVMKSPPNQRHRTAGLTFLLVATFVISWAPYNIVYFLETLSYFFPITFSKHLNYASYICCHLAYTRSCLNPVIYGILGVKFRKRVREIFQSGATLNSAPMGMGEHHDETPC